MANESATPSPNAGMRMSPAARTRMREAEKVIRHYYNDMGKNKGNCTWGAGILAHRGVCNEEELARKVSEDDVRRVFDQKVAQAESTVRRKIDRVALNQDQFDALVSLTYNAGADGANDTYLHVNSGEFAAAADNISSMIKVRVKKRGKWVMVVARGLIKRRAEESAPFRGESPKEGAQK